MPRSPLQEEALFPEPDSTAGKTRTRSLKKRDETRPPIPAPIPEGEIRDEAHLLKLIGTGVYTLDQLYDLSKEIGVFERNGGMGARSSGHSIGEHRMRTALDAAQRRGSAKRVERTHWAVAGTPARPKRAILVIMGGPSDIELSLGAAADIARELNEPVDLVFCDPPWQLDVGLGRDGLSDKDFYGRDRAQLVGGYQEVPRNVDYFDFSVEWIEQAVSVMGAAGYLAVVTGPRQAAAVQRAGEVCGLNFQNSLVVPKVNGTQPTRNRFATSHNRVTVMTKGSERLRRTFNILPETPRAQRSGEPFPTDILPPVKQYQQPGQLRYPNQLQPAVVDLLVRTYTNPGNLVADFFNGSGTTGMVCLYRGRAYRGSDINNQAIRFTMGRMLESVLQEHNKLDMEVQANAFAHIHTPGGRMIDQQGRQQYMRDTGIGL